MIQAVKGTKDLFGAEATRWANMEATIRDVCKAFCIGEIRTPVFEYTELFVKTTGDTTDIVQKEMYTFTDKGGRSITLKPEVTAAVVRAFLEHKLYAQTLPSKLFYLSPCFRYEKPQAGRLRQFHQFGAEYFGVYHPAADAEMISLAHEVLKRLGIPTRLYINSLGGNACRAKYNKRMKEFLQENLDKLCPTCQERFEKNPLRVLDCKDPSCQAVLEGAPSTIDTLDTECRNHFETTLSLLKQLGINAEINHKMVRGLDYYTRTVFEFVSDDIGAQSAVCGGGRYDNLIEVSGGSPMGGIGFAMGLERLMLSLAKNAQEGNEVARHVDLYLGAIGAEGFKKAQHVAFQLREAGVCVEADMQERSVKAQMKFADKIGAKYSAILGDDELANNCVKLKNMETGEQVDAPLSELAQYIIKE